MSAASTCRHRDGRSMTFPIFSSGIYCGMQVLVSALLVPALQGEWRLKKQNPFLRVFIFSKRDLNETL